MDSQAGGPSSPFVHRALSRYSRSTDSAAVLLTRICQLSQLRKAEALAAMLQEQISQAITQETVLPEVVDNSGQPKVLGKGFVVERIMNHIRLDLIGSVRCYREEWLVEHA